MSYFHLGEDGDEVGARPLRLAEVVERSIAAALKPYNPYLGRGENAHQWVARRCAEEAAHAAQTFLARDQ